MIIRHTRLSAEKASAFFGRAFGSDVLIEETFHPAKSGDPITAIIDGTKVTAGNVTILSMQ
jgi:hypothetical protein